MGDVIEDTCPLCHGPASETRGFDPITITCHRCGKRAYSRVYCANMWDNPLTKKEAAYLAGGLRESPTWQLTTENTLKMATRLVNSVDSHRRSMGLLRRLAALYGRDEFHINFKDQPQVLDLLGAAFAVDEVELRASLDWLVDQGILDRASDHPVMFAGQITRTAWTQLLGLPIATI